MLCKDGGGVDDETSLATLDRKIFHMPGCERSAQEGAVQIGVYNLLEILHAVDSVSFIWDDLFEMDDAGTVDVISDSSEDGVGLFVGLLDLSLV